VSGVSWHDEDDIDVSVGCAIILFGLAMALAFTLGLWHAFRLVF
jgi:hypothetical protein